MMKTYYIPSDEYLEVLDADYPSNEDGSYASTEPDMFKLERVGWVSASECSLFKA